MSLVPDLDEARRFIAALTGGAASVLTLQSFDDSPGKRRELASWKYDLVDELVPLNEQGAGCFLMINEGDGLGRSNKNVRRVRAVFVDLDGAPLEPVTAHHHPPHIVVESSPGRFHAYWRVDGLPLSDFAGVQKAIARQFDGDPSVHDLARVMRLPGFIHRKGKPFRTRLVSVDGRPPYPASVFSIPAAARETGYAAPIGNVITSPGRHEALASLARTLSARGVCPEAIRACLLAVNEHQCSPPLTGRRRLSEIDEIVRWATGLPVLSPLTDPEMPAADTPVEVLREATRQ